MSTSPARPLLDGTMRALSGASAVTLVLGLGAVGGGIAGEEIGGTYVAWLFAVGSLPTLALGLAWELRAHRRGDAAGTAEPGRA